MYLTFHLSLPSRGAWIEILAAAVPVISPLVAPLAGSVDRNVDVATRRYVNNVAPLAGSVDRNYYDLTLKEWRDVAPLAGSVDRNCVQ